jgi:hypothetical protein
MMASARSHPSVGIRLEGLRNTTKTWVRISSLNGTPPDYEWSALPLHQPAHFLPSHRLHSMFFPELKT